MIYVFKHKSTGKNTLVMEVINSNFHKFFTITEKRLKLNWN
jgi:hypothetical protein